MCYVFKQQVFQLTTGQVERCGMKEVLTKKPALAVAFETGFSFRHGLQQQQNQRTHRWHPVQATDPGTAPAV
jgi:hypothetical protein